MNIQLNGIVRHEKYGRGTVRYIDKDVAGVRFDHGVEECSLVDLTPLSTPHKTLAEGEWHSPVEVVARLQAQAIQSINDEWGVFSRSRVTLLPHQLWVCKKVTEDWPARWLVADDVGLGKTIEAGLIVARLIDSGAVRRLLVLVPASLVPQWIERLRNMFDIRLSGYTPEQDNDRYDFWNTQNQVAASVQTLRLDHNGRHDRLLEAAPWDLLIVDEAHHLNADEQEGPTLGYKLVHELAAQEKVSSMIFFTGTPHRGKTFGFLALLQLLRPDLFDPRRPSASQFPFLREVMIRNNKYSVTDLHGEKLFVKPLVSTETYDYSPEERRFYNMLTEFIVSGRAYAFSLDRSRGSAVMLVLIAMQKLASSSVAAIRKALRNRIARIDAKEEDARKAEDAYKKLKDEMGEAEYVASPEAFDQLARLEESIAEASLKLMEDERDALKTLLDAAEAVVEETKVQRIIHTIRSKFEEASVVLFTEYKATQALILSAILQEFGPNCATFINGDDRLEDVTALDGARVVLRMDRTTASEQFSRGEKRFLVSTEAGGEGIDLQESCHCLIHADLPWNPMRLHQRVGRLNRYGQTQQVRVALMLNPATVEAKVWEKLNEKLDTIQRAFGSVMDDPEDLMNLVLGATPNSTFDRLFSGGHLVSSDNFSVWFDKESATLGGEDIVSAVKAIAGNCARFDFQGVSGKIPQLDLPDLKPFFTAALRLNGRTVSELGETISFKTPDSWIERNPRVRRRYEGMVFDRKYKGRDAIERVLGVGHPAFDKALAMAKEMDVSIALVDRTVLDAELFFFLIRDRLTGSPVSRQLTLVGIQSMPDGMHIIEQASLLRRLNAIMQYIYRKTVFPERAAVTELDCTAEQAAEFLRTRMPELALPYQHPECELLAILFPAWKSS